ncbi:MAG: TolC family protein [Candidatus Omnitrophica bacterium]|nr:TolC family protein [Candidatus Omnitrophota bacterium]MDD5488246.1 TolC family protein [Candidatus Omnitrophota bacterium]
MRRLLISVVVTQMTFSPFTFAWSQDKAAFSDEEKDKMREDAMAEAMRRLKVREAEEKEAVAEARKRLEEKAKQDAVLGAANEFVLKATQALNEKDFRNARKYAKAALEIAPDLAQAEELLKMVDFAELEYEPGQRELFRKERTTGKDAAQEEEGSSERSAEISASLKAAGAYLAQGDTRRARAAARAVLAEDDKNKQAQLLLARTYVAEKRSARPVVPAGKTSAGSSQNTTKQTIDSYLSRAKASLERNELYAARIFAEKAYQLDSMDPDVDNVISRIASAEQEYAAAEERLRREAEEKKRAEEEEARRRDEEERLARERTSRIEELLDQADRHIEENNFIRARKAADDLRGMGETGTADSLYGKIQDAELIYKEEKAIAEKAERVKKFVQEGEKALSSGDLELARKYADEALGEEGGDGTAEDLSARIDKAKKEVEAAEALRRAERVAAALDQARKELENNGFEKARIYVREALQLESGNETAQKLLKEIYLGEEEYRAERERKKRQAEEEERNRLEALKKAQQERELEQRKERVAWYLEQAAEKNKDREFDRAREYVKKALTIDPTSEKAKKTVRVIDADEEEYINELRQRKKVSEERKKEEEEARAREEEAARKRELEEARKRKEIQDLERTTRVNDLLEKAELALDGKDFSAAREYVNKALTLEGNNVKAISAMQGINSAEREYEANKLRRQEELNKQQKEEKAAAETARIAMEEQLKREAQPGVSEYIDKAEEELSRGNYEEARVYARKAIGADPNNVVAHRLITRSYMEEKKGVLDDPRQEEKAPEVQEKPASEGKAGSSAIDNELVAAREKMAEGDFSGARTHARKVLSVDSNNLEAQSIMTTSYLREREKIRGKDTVRALKNKEEAARPSSREIKSVMDEAIAALNENEFEKAMGLAEKARQMDPSNEETKTLIEQIGQLRASYERDVKAKEQAEAESEKQKEEREARAREEQEARAREEQDARAREEQEARVREEQEARAREEKEAKGFEKRITGYLDKAERSLEEQDFSKARSYAEKALELAGSDERARDMIDAIDLAQRTYAEEERKRKEAEEAARKAREEEARRSEKERAREKALESMSYFKTASDLMGQGKFDEARKNIYLAFNIPEDSLQAKILLSEYDFHDKNGKKFTSMKEIREGSLSSIDAEERSKKEIEEAARKAEEEEKARERELREREEKITGYLDRARGYLEKGSFDRARGYAENALKVDESDERAREMINAIDSAERTYAEEERKRKEAEEAERKARQEAAAREKEAREAAEREKKITGYLDRARGYLEKDSFGRARSYAENALKVDGNDERAREMIDAIDSAERTYAEEERKRKEAEEAERKARQEAAAREKEEREAAKAAEKSMAYFKKASDMLDRGRYDQARKYVDIAFNIPEDSAQARIILSEYEFLDKNGVQITTIQGIREGSLSKIEEAEATTAAGRLEEKVQAESVDPGVDASAERSEADQEKINNYLAKARGYLDQGNCAKARAMMDKASRLGAAGTDADILRIAIENAERKERERLVDEKAAQYAEKAEKALDRNRFDEAENYVQKALELKEGDEALNGLLTRISSRKQEHEAEMRMTKEEEEARKQAEEAVRAREKEEARREKARQQADKDIAKAQEFFDAGDYGQARHYLYQVKDSVPDDSRANEMLTEIDKAEMFGKREKLDDIRREKLELSMKEPDGDPMKEHNEPKGWMDQMTGMFEKRTDGPRNDTLNESHEYTIDECVNASLNANQRVVVADKQVKLAEMRLWETRRELLPSVTGKIERSYGKIGQGSSDRHYQGEKYQVELKQTLWDGFGTWFKVKQSQTNLEITMLERGKIENEVVETTKKAYYNLDKSIKAFDLQEKFNGKVSEIHEFTEKAYERELIPKVEYLKVKGQKMQSDFQKDSAKEDVRLAEMILLQAMDMDSDKHIMIKPVRRPGEWLTIGLENCYSLAYANRPDFKIKEKTIEYYEFERKMMKAKGWPKFEFNGSFGQSVETYQPTSSGGEQRGLAPEWYAGVKASLPMWGNTLEYNYVREKWAPTVSSFRGTESATSYFSFKLLDDLAYFSNLQESQVGFESAKYEYLKAKKDVTVEVKEAYFSYKKALLQMEVAEARIEHQKMYVKTVEERMRYGETLEPSRILEEYEKLSTEEYSQVDSDSNYYKALVDLNKAIGVSEYFKPEYEDMEYEEWKKATRYAELDLEMPEEQKE